MSGILEPGYVDFSLFILRDGDPDPYVVTFAGEIETPPFTQDHCDSVAFQCAGELGGLLWDEESMVMLNARVGNDGPPFIYSSPMNAPGTSSADRPPQNVSLIFRKNTGLGGRRNRGRMFWPSVSEASLDGVGNVAGSTISTTEGLLNDWMEGTFGPSAVGTNLSQMVILHSTPPATPTPVTSLTVDPVCGTQRRRLRR